jgi:hypothetical protein
VLEAVLATCGAEERRALLAELLEEEEGGRGERAAKTTATAVEGGEEQNLSPWSLEDAMDHPYGNYVFQRALRVADADQRASLLRAVALAGPRLSGSRHGKPLLARAEEVEAEVEAERKVLALQEKEGEEAVPTASAIDEEEVEEEHDAAKEDLPPPAASPKKRPPSPPPPLPPRTLRSSRSSSSLRRRSPPRLSPTPRPLRVFPWSPRRGRSSSARERE